MATAMGQAALAAAERVPMIPIWWSVDGVCACPEGARCGSPAKHPILKGWQKKATRDPERIRRLWRRYPRANIGMPTGRASGYVVLDVELKYGRPDLPATFVVRTGTGEHWYYRAPDHRCPNRKIKAFGVDVLRGDGGYVLIPPSVHASGAVYEKLGGRVARFPVALLDRLPPRVGKTGARASGLIPEGERNDVLFDIGASLRARHMGRDAIAGSLLAINESHCCPPLEAAEVRRIAEQAASYEPGAAGVRWPRINRRCPFCGGTAAATFKWNHAGRPEWFVSCFGECSPNGSYLPDLGEKLGLGRAANKETIVLRWAERGRVHARTPVSPTAGREDKEA